MNDIDSKKAEVFVDGNRFGKPHIQILKADYGDLDPTTNSTAKLLAGYYYSNLDNGDFQYIGEDIAEVFQWIQSVRDEL